MTLDTHAYLLSDDLDAAADALDNAKAKTGAGEPWQMVVLRPAAAPRNQETRACSSSKSAPGRIRTCDQEIRRLLLYPLSYGGKKTSLEAR
jgi:hypothetical protein